MFVAATPLATTKIATEFFFTSGRNCKSVANAIACHCVQFIATTIYFVATSELRGVLPVVHSPQLLQVV